MSEELESDNDISDMEDMDGDIQSANELMLEKLKDENARLRSQLEEMSKKMDIQQKQNEKLQEMISSLSEDIKFLRKDAVARGERKLTKKQKKEEQRKEYLANKNYKPKQIAPAKRAVPSSSDEEGKAVASTSAIPREKPSFPLLSPIKPTPKPKPDTIIPQIFPVKDAELLKSKMAPQKLPQTILVNKPPSTSTSTPNTKMADPTPSTSSTEEPPKRKTVPIILREPQKWTEVRRILTSQNTKIAQAKRVHLGIQIQPETPNDHRKIIQIFTERKYQYHTYLHEEEKCLNVVIKGLEGITPEEVKEDLESQGFHPIECYHLKTRDSSTRLVKVLLPRNEKHIYNASAICHLIVKIEAQKPKAVRGQCHNCQQFGHAANRCMADPKCVKCDGNHHFNHCQKPPTEKPVCTNCGGDHPANYGGCPKHPSNVKKTYAQKTAGAAATPNAQPTKKPTSSPSATPAQLPSNNELAYVERFFVNMQSQFNTMMKDMMSSMILSKFSAQK